MKIDVLSSIVIQRPRGQVVEYAAIPTTPPLRFLLESR